MKISILDTGASSARENMERDAQLLKDLDPNGTAILHLYNWASDSLTYGYFAKADQLLDFKGLAAHQIDHARRCTGGGVTLHFTDLAFSFLLPAGHEKFSENTIENYQFVASVVKEALRPLLKGQAMEDYKTRAKEVRDEERFFCMAKPTRYDVMIGNKKVGGAAQRKTKLGYLHHGTIAIARPDETVLRDILKDKDSVWSAILENGFYFVDNHLKRKEVEGHRKEIRERLISSFKSV